MMREFSLAFCLRAFKLDFRVHTVESSRSHHFRSSEGRKQRGKPRAIEDCLFYAPRVVTKKGDQMGVHERQL